MKTLPFRFALLLLVCLLIRATATAQTVDIPDSNLRAAIETDLGKASGDPITAAEMETLTFFRAIDANISDLTGLEYATNLTYLFLWNNSISDLSPLSGLTNLQYLDLQGNLVSDLSPMLGLTNLFFLGLWNNSISELSPLVINTGLGEKDGVNVKGNLLSYPSIYTHIPVLQERGVEVLFDNRTPTTPRIISGDNQNAITGVTLGQPFVVEVRDENGVVFEGVPVTFTVTAGGGTVQPEIAVTDADGRAESILTLGSDPVTNTVEVNVEGLAEPAIFTTLAELHEFDLTVLVGISLIHVPLKVRAVDGIPTTIGSVGDLYDALGGADTINWLITYDHQTQTWIGYFGPPDRGTTVDRELTEDMGILINVLAPVSVRLVGDALGTDGMSTITLHQRVNLIGLPLQDSRITRVSDLFALEGIIDNVPAIVVTDNGEFKLVGRAGDEGDIEITGGQAFILIAHQAETVPISGDGWTNTSGTAAAPPVAMGGIVADDVTPILALSGSIGSHAGGWGKMPHLRSGFRVILKNRSTGREVATVTADDEAGYRLTIVDIETGRAAQIGDILEISAQSLDTSIGVESLRYTVTAEDVKRSRIQLPTLVSYEMPAETQLLANYPNPFNPETWIPYRLAEDASVALTIYDGSGQIVRTLNVGHQVAAAYESRPKAAYWDGRNEVGEPVASGVYFYYLSAGDFSATRKMVILK